jgi:Conjugative transposon protein TcpC
VSPRPIWRLRLVREMPRYVILASAVAGLLASVRFAISPPSVRAPRVRGPLGPRVDRAAEGFATLFVRRYLSWSTAAPAALAPFAGAEGEVGLAPSPPASSEQHVEWAEVVQARDVDAAVHVYTVAAQTDTAGLLYVTVAVARAAGGGLAISGYPAFVGAPATAPAQPPGRLAEVSEPALQTVLERGLRNYLAGSRSELEADLAPAARVSLPALGLRLESVARLAWSADRRSVSALVHAQDARGVRYALAYEVEVVRRQGRWEIAAVQMDPNA